jgi:hypothetical protein
MEKKFVTYTQPEITVIVLEAEQAFLAGSNAGGNESLYGDPTDYSDYFE